MPTFKKLVTRSKLQVSNAAMRFFPDPRVFLSVVQSELAGFPLKACGNDGAMMYQCAASREELTNSD